MDNMATTLLLVGLISTLTGIGGLTVGLYCGLRIAD